ncbi:MAG: NAD(P)-dependent oxidoreductase [Bacteroides sp.]|nr:NAD(P)-dependent oxidoreductase [Bacteroides sp.]MBD5376023.1 NAD(P)-dependent oxidoreductase [Bacteroides sp.]
MNLLITGASGLVATELIFSLLKNKDYHLTLLSRNTDEIFDRYGHYHNQIESITIEEAYQRIPYPKYDCVIHTAFARSPNGHDIAASLSYLSNLCTWLKEGIVRKFINISSQSVYGSDYKAGIKESETCSPDYLYAMGKYASEIIVTGFFTDTSTEVINLRLASVCENARFMKIFVGKALNGEKIELTAPQQTVSFIDVRDVSTAILQIIAQKHSVSGTYNLGTGQWYTIKHVTERIKELGEQEYNIKPLLIKITNNHNSSSIGMSNELFTKTFHWTSNYTLDDMIRSLYEMLTNANGGG